VDIVFTTLYLSTIQDIFNNDIVIILLRLDPSYVLIITVYFSIHSFWTYVFQYEHIFYLFYHENHFNSYQICVNFVGK